MVDQDLIMTTIVLIALAWAVVFFIVSRKGSGIPNRSVHCPERNTRARVSVLFYTKPGWKGEQVKDIVSCSLMGDGAVTCDKKCLAQI